MKQLAVIKGVRLVGLVVTGLLAGGCAQEAGQRMRPQEVGMAVIRQAATEVSATLDEFHRAAAKADFARYFAAWTDESVFLGTDATERWTGDEFKAFARPHFEKGKGWTYLPRERRLTVAPDGRSAYFDELLDNEQLGVCRGSGVVQSVGGEWKIMQYNLSIPIPNEAAGKVVELIRPAADPNEPKHRE